MRRLALLLVLTLAAASVLAPPAVAARKLKVVATIPDLKSLTEAVDLIHRIHEMGFHIAAHARQQSARPGNEHRE